MTIALQGYHHQTVLMIFVTICLNYFVFVLSSNEMDNFDGKKVEMNSTNDNATAVVNRTSRQFYPRSPVLMKNFRAPHHPMLSPRNDRLPFMPQLQQSARPRMPNGPAQVRRRIQSNLPPGSIRNFPSILRPQNFYPPQENALKNLRIANVKNGPINLNAREVSMPGRGGSGGSGSASGYYRPQTSKQQYPLYHHPNAIHHQQEMGFNFKASPTFNGKVIMRPVHQYPIPMSAQEQAQIDTQAIYQQTPHIHQSQINYYHQQQQKHQQQHQQHQEQQQQLQQEHRQQFPPTVGNSYAVHEEPNEDRDNVRSQQLTSQANSMKEAQNYLNFMGSNEYFLPKLTPDYRKVNYNNNNLVNSKQQQQQQQTIREHKWVTASPSMLSSLPSSSSASNSPATSTYGKPMRTGNVYSRTTVPPPPPPPPARSQQPDDTDNIQHMDTANFFVVNSDGKRKVNRFVHDPLHESKQQITGPRYEAQKKTTYTHHTITHRKTEGVGGGAQGNNDRNTGPERFEFTERDAIHATYTSNPINAISQKKNNPNSGSTGASGSGNWNGNGSGGTSSVNVVHREIYGVRPPALTSTTVAYANAKPVREHFYDNDRDTHNDADDDDNNDDDIHRDAAAASSDLNGRTRIGQNNSTSVSTTETPSEQTDTEEFCEQICVNVQDEDEEIVCGSDGFMYTSEAQMDCYSSCLRIDVYIQNKGTCTS